KIAVEETTFGSSATNISYLNLPDTMSYPSGSFGRIRIVDLSPDHAAITVTLAGQSLTMSKRDVVFLNVPIGMQDLVLKDGINSMTRQINVSPIRPGSIYLLSEKSATPAFPISVSQD
ncbi:MAG: hypothetical protein ABI778_12555, partial [Ignavibacteriota bacterium]